MAYGAVTLPLTGTGDATAKPAVDIINANAYQAVKLVDGLEGSTEPVRAKGTTPGATDHGIVVRPIGSTAHNQAVVGAVGLTSGSSQVGITSGSSEVALTSVGSTRLVGRVDVNNPTTSVNVANPTTAVSVANPTTAVNVANQPTVDLSSVGSTRVVGTVNATGTTQVSVSSGVILGAGSSANVLGAVAQGPGGSSANNWIVDGFSFSSGNAIRTTVNTSAAAQVRAANTNRRAMAIQNLTTVDVALAFSTAAPSTALANISYILGSRGNLTFGGQVGSLPNYTGSVMGITIGSTTISGGVVVTEFTST